MSVNLDKLLPWSIEKIDALRECGLKFWFMYVADSNYLVKDMVNIQEELVRTITKALLLGDRTAIVFGVKRLGKKVDFTAEDTSAMILGMTNLYDRIQNLMRKLPEAKLLPNLRFGVDLNGMLYDWYDPRAYFRMNFDITIEYTVPDMTPRRKAYRVIDFHSGKIYQAKTDHILNIKAACLKLARGAGVYRMEYQIALITESPALRDVVLTPVKKRAVRHMGANIIRDFVEEYTPLLPANLSRLSYEKKYLSSKNCAGCIYSKYCHKD